MGKALIGEKDKADQYQVANEEQIFNLTTERDSVKARIRDRVRSARS